MTVHHHPDEPNRVAGPGHARDHRHDHGHPHDHGHEHEHGHARGPLGRVRELVWGHGHDAADRVDSALEASQAGMRCLGGSFAGLTLTAAAQAVVVAVSGSVALLGDALHNFADALTAVPLAIAFTVGRRAATRRYTYGFGRAEDLAGLVVAALIALSAVAAGWEAMLRLLNPRQVSALPLVAAAALIGFVGNELVARYRIRVGRRIGSAALVAGTAASRRSCAATSSTTRCCGTSRGSCTRRTWATTATTRRRRPGWTCSAAACR
jgi:Cation efflux family